MEQAELLLDNWDVMGLRGTGSIDYNIDEVFVPEGCSHFAFTTEPRRGGPCTAPASSASPRSATPAGRSGWAGDCWTSSPAWCAEGRAGGR